MANSKINREQIETIISVHATSNNVKKAADAANVAWSTAKKYIDRADNGEVDEEIGKLREKKKKEVIDKAWENISLFLQLMNKKAPDACLRDVTGAFGMTAEKLMKLIGEDSEGNINIYNTNKAEASNDTKLEIEVTESRDADDVLDNAQQTEGRISVD